MTLKAIVHKAEEGGFWAEVPALPGCVTQAETIDELRANLQDAIKLWFEAGEPAIAVDCCAFLEILEGLNEPAPWQC
jgi:predicted RNase H-like HicB family nuclease